MGDSRPPLAKALFNRRMLICIFTGFSSGLPLYILINLLPAWLRSEHVDLKAIGLFALIQLAVHVEIHLVAAGRSLRAAAARPAARLDAGHAGRC